AQLAACVPVETVVTFLTTRTSDDSWPFGFDPALSAAGNRVRTAIQLAHLQVLETAITSQSYSGMGTTIVASLVEGNRLSVGHVGDSRLYILANDRLRQVTHDDSWMASMLPPHPSLDVTPLA